MRSRAIRVVFVAAGLIVFAVMLVGLYSAVTLLFPRPPEFSRTGGYVFVYEVDVPADHKAGRVIDRVIEVLQDRVDPGGFRRVAFRRLPDNRIEIRVPVRPDVRRLRHSYLEARRALLAVNFDEAELDRLLDLPGTDREEAWPRLLEAHPALAGEIQALADACTAYEQAKDSLDDPREVMRLLRGAGLLELHIAVRASAPEGVEPDDLRDQLAERGLEETDSPVARWFPINDLKQWYDTPKQLEYLQADPSAYLASAGWDLVGARRDGQYYLLLYITPAKSMTHEGGQTWAVAGVYPTVDNYGRTAVGFQLDTSGGREMGRLTARHVGEPMAIVLDGEVYSAPRIRQAIALYGVIMGNFSKAEHAYLLRLLDAGSMEAAISRDPISLEEVAAEP